MRYTAAFPECAFLLALLLSMTACHNDGKAVTVALTPEQELLAEINNIDSVTFQTIINPDSVEGFDKLSTLSAESWMLIDDSTGMVISQKYANEPQYMASLTKMMTCLLALENGNMADTVEITKDVFISRNSRVRLGERYLLGNLIYEMMLQSDNDAAYAIAKHLAGDTLKFCEIMNEKAAYIGMSNTHFANPNGMPNINNYSTACDLIRLARYSMRDSAFATVVGTAYKDVPLVDGRHMACYNAGHS